MHDNSYNPYQPIGQIIMIISAHDVSQVYDFKLILVVYFFIISAPIYTLKLMFFQFITYLFVLVTIAAISCMQGISYSTHSPLRYMFKRYITAIISCSTSKWYHTNCWALVSQHHKCGGRLPHNKTLLQKDISNESSFKR